MSHNLKIYLPLENSKIFRTERFYPFSKRKKKKKDILVAKELIKFLSTCVHTTDNFTYEITFKLAENTFLKCPLSPNSS